MADSVLITKGSESTYDHTLVDYFKLPPTDLTGQKVQYIEYQPLTSGTPVRFEIQDEVNFIDLSRSYFRVTVKFQTAAGGELQTASHVFLARSGVHSMFKQINVWLNKTLLSPQSDMYAWKSDIGIILNYTPEEADDVLYCSGAYKAGDFPNPVTANNLNAGGPHQDYTDLSQPAKDGYARAAIKKVSFMTVGNASLETTYTFKPVVELFQTKKLMVPGMKMEFQFDLNPPSFYLTTTLAAQPILNMASFKMTFHACSLNLRTPVAERILKAMVQGNTIYYPLITTEVRRHVIAADTREISQDRLFEDRIPFRMHVVMVAQNNFLGTRNYTPFLYKRFGMLESRLTVNDQIQGGRPIRYVAGASTTDLLGYDRFRRESGLEASRGRCLVDPTDHSTGSFIQCWDLTPTGSAPNYAHMLPKGTGNMRLEMTFDAATVKPIIYMLVYGEFQSTLEVASDKTVYFDARG